MNSDLKHKTTYSPNVTFLYPLKTSKKPGFSDVFRGYRNVTLGEYGLRETVHPPLGLISKKKLL